MPTGPAAQQSQGQNQQQQQPQGPKGTAPIGPPAGNVAKPNAQPKVAEADGSAKPAESKAPTKPSGTTPTPSTAAKQPPPPPVESKPDVAAALAPPQPNAAGARPTPTGPRSGRIIPAVPLASPGVSKTVPQPVAQVPVSASAAQAGTSNQSAQNATAAATAAVAAAMAKLNLAANKPAQPASSGALDNLTQRVNDMRVDDQIRHGRQPGTGGFAAGGRGGRGGRGRGGHHHQKMEVPTTDFDFESANAKFNKQELVKEAIASGSPLGENAPAASAESATNGQSSSQGDEVVIPPAAYNKGTSFFDNISSELKDREGQRGQEFRNEERRKNMETFGQGSVDGYRGGYRGRGRGGRGRGGRGFNNPNFRPRGGAPRGGRGQTPASNEI